jgi:hypothetical protein
MSCIAASCELCDVFVERTPVKIGIYCYTWDFADNGVDELLEWCVRAGITDLFLAATYHSGWFLHSHNPKHKAYLATSGAIYFHPNRDLYGRIQPYVAPMCEEHDHFQEICQKAAEYGIKVTAWTIGAHNTRLGLQHPDCCVTNCFGDTYPHALCPAHPDVRQYLLALCQDIGGNFPVESIRLESFGYEGWKHDHQHERDFHGLTPLEKELMGLCFNPATMKVAESRSIEATLVRQGVARLLQSAFDSAPERPQGHPREWSEAEEQIPGLNDYRDCMRQINQNLILESEKTMAPAACHNLTTSTLGAYGEDASFIQNNITGVRDLSPELPLWVTLLLGASEVPSREFLTEAVNAARSGGADGMVFYNYSEAPRRILEWLSAKESRGVKQ